LSTVTLPQITYFKVNTFLFLSVIMKELKIYFMSVSV
jgi:hypothetical protein